MLIQFETARVKLFFGNDVKNQYIGLRYFYQFNDEVGDLLHEHDQPRWLLVVGGVGPDETDHVIKGRDAFLQLLELTLLQDLNLTTQWLQVHAASI